MKARKVFDELRITWIQDLIDNKREMNEMNGDALLVAKWGICPFDWLSVNCYSGSVAPLAN